MSSPSKSHPRSIRVSLSVDGDGLDRSELDDIQRRLERVIDRTIRKMAGPDNQVVYEPGGEEMWGLSR